MNKKIDISIRYMYDMECYHWWFVSRRNLVVYLMKSLKISFSIIFDVGSGTGGNLMVFNKLGKTFGDDALCHLRRYKKDSLSRDLDEAGLKVEKMSYFFFTSFFVVTPIRIMRRFIVLTFELLKS